MITQSIVDHCLKCREMKKAFEDGVDNEYLVFMRRTCSYCRSTYWGGIYKADAIYSALTLLRQGIEKQVQIEQLKEALQAQESKRNKGKKATYHKRYGTAIMELRGRGESLRSIASILGISVNSVQTVLRRLNDTR